MKAVNLFAAASLVLFSATLSANERTDELKEPDYARFFSQFKEYQSCSDESCCYEAFEACTANVADGDDEQCRNDYEVCVVSLGGGE